MKLGDIKVGNYVKIITHGATWGYGDTRENMESNKFYLVKSLGGLKIGLHNPSVPTYIAFFYLDDIERLYNKETNPELYL